MSKHRQVTVGAHDYVIGKLDAFAQFHVSRRLAPVIPTIAPLLMEIAKGGLQSLLANIEAVKQGGDKEGGTLHDLTELATAAIPFADALANMSDEHANYVINTCLGVVKRDTGKSLAHVCRNGSLMFDDLDIGDMLPLVIEVLKSSLGNFIRGLVTNVASETANP